MSRFMSKHYRFANLYDTRLKSDRYRCRTSGVPEALCTGNASNRENSDTRARTASSLLCHWRQLAQVGLVSRFVGMLTDYRRLLCQMIGNRVVRGEAPADEARPGQRRQSICFNNAHDYFGIARGA